MSAGFENWFVLGYLLWLPLLTALYFFNVKPRRKVVSSHFLWQKVLAKKRRNSLFEKFQGSVFYWLQALIFLLVFAAISRPYLSSVAPKKEAVVFVDTSASMQSRMAGETRMDNAIRDVQGLVMRAGSSMSFSIYSCALQCHGLMSETIAGSIAQLKASELPSPPFRHLRSMVSAQRAMGREVFIVTDSLSITEQLELERIGASFKVIGSGGENVWIADLRQSSPPMEAGLVVGVARSGQIRDAVVIARTSDRKEISRAQVKFDGIRAQEVQEVHLPISSLPPEIHVEVSHPTLNLLPLDDKMIFWPKRARLQLALEVPRGESFIYSFIERFISLDPGLQIVSAAQDAQIRIGWSKDFDPHIRLIRNSGDAHEFLRSFVLDPTSLATMYLDGQQLPPADWHYKEGEYHPLILAIGHGGKVSVPILACQKQSGGRCDLNLRDDEAIDQNLELSIFLENYFRLALKETLAAPVLVTGIERPEELNLLVPLFSQPTEASSVIDLIGVWKESDNLVFVKIPESESGMSVQEAVESIGWREAGRRSDAEISDREFIDGIILLLALGILTLEWILYLRRV